MTLSVIIISHNQREQVKRCIESVLSQELPFEYEIVISDDASTDGTWELELDYAAKYLFIKVYQCNSNDCNPSYGSERSGHNRSNAYRHASGKYFCHIDGDDYYRPGSSCLKEMVALLEEHPECSICMQNGWVLKDGASIEEGTPFYQEYRFSTGQVLTAKEYLQSGLFVNNGAMMMRRNAAENPADLYHKWYVDSVITAHHLQFGSIVCLDTADWVYVQYSDSITSSIASLDCAFLWNLDSSLLLSVLVPSLSPYYYASIDNRKSLLDTVRLILKKEHFNISHSAEAFFSQFPKIFLFRLIASRKLPFIDRVRVEVLKRYLKYLSGILNPGGSKLQLVDFLCKF